MIDGTIVPAHQKASGAKGGTQHQAIERSRGGLSTKIVGMVDALGNLFRFFAFARTGARHERGRPADPRRSLWSAFG